MVVPAAVATPHDTKGSGVVITNQGLNLGTSPPEFGIPLGQVELDTIYARVLTITVVDQFGDGLGNIYSGAEVEEGASFPAKRFYKKHDHNIDAISN